ncbi:MAG: porphobilinogen synthase, partial [Patescibacteria group bacterium]|nr:porphobilinogen synthase [Patescibacteria group bacterium]
MFKRFRERRINEETRQKFRETFLAKSDFIWPVFIVDGTGIKNEIPAMKDVFRYSTDQLLEELRPLVDQGLKSVLLF